MPRRKAQAPQQALGRVEDRHLAAATDSDDAGAAGLQGEWHMGSGKDDSEVEVARRPAKRRKRLQRRRQGGGGEISEQRSVAIELAPAADQPWRFAELPVAWQAAAGTSQQAADELPLEEGQLALMQDPPGGDSLAVRCESGGAWHTTVTAPSEASAEALLLLLKSGHLSCSLGATPSSKGASAGTVHLCLTDKATADAAGHPEEQQQRLWHRQLLAVLRWLLPQLDPEKELEQLEQLQQQPASDHPEGGQQWQQQGGLAAELLSSPLCSPRKAGGSAGAGRFGTPLSPSAAGAPVAFDAAELYAAVKPSGREPELPAGATSATLLPTLRRYQVI